MYFLKNPKGNIKKRKSLYMQITSNYIFKGLSLLFNNSMAIFLINKQNDKKVTKETVEETVSHFLEFTEKLTIIRTYLGLFFSFFKNSLVSCWTVESTSNGKTYKRW